SAWRGGQPAAARRDRNPSFPTGANMTDPRKATSGIAFFFLVTAFLLSGKASAAGDAVAGKTVFATQCSSCHTVQVGKHGFGPSLAGVFERKAGSLAGFGYSPAMAHVGLVWDEKNLDEFLAASTQKVPGTSMAVFLPNAVDRANVIAYLE